MMKKIDMDVLLRPMSYIGGAISEWRLLQQMEGHVVPAQLPLEARAGFMRSVELLKGAAADLEMRTTVGVIDAGWRDALEQLAANRPLSAHKLQRLVGYGERVVTVFTTEIGARALISLAPRHAAFAEPTKPPVRRAGGRRLPELSA